MDNGKKFVFSDIDTDNIEEVNEEPTTANRFVTDAEVEEHIHEHAEKSNPDPTNPGNTEHSDPIEVEPEIVDEKEKKAGSMINGKMLIFMINIVIPLIIKYAGQSLNKKIEIDLDALKMDHEDEELLGPSAEHVAEIIFGDLGPVPQFFIGLSVIYASKLPDAIKKKEPND